MYQRAYANQWIPGDGLLINLHKDYGEMLEVNPETGERMKELSSVLESLDTWTAENIKTTIKNFADTKQIKMGALMFPLRVCATGVGQGTDLMPTLEAIGRVSTVARIKERVDKIYTDN